MPLLNYYWDERKFNWLNSIIDMKRNYNIDILISLSIHGNERLNQKAAYLDPPSCQPIFKSFKTKHEAIREIITLLKKYSDKSAEIEAAAREINDIEIDLYENIPEVSPGNRDDYIDLRQANNKFSSDTTYYNTYIKSLMLHNSNNNFISTSGYFKNLQETLSSRSNKSIANYIMWSFIRHMNVTTNQGENTNRNIFCLSLIKQYFPQVLGYMYWNYPSQYQDHESMKEAVNFFGTQLNAVYESKINIHYMEYNQRDKANRLPNTNPENIQVNNFLQNILALMEPRNKKFIEFKEKNEMNVESFSIFPIYQLKEIKVPKAMFNSPLYYNKFPNSTKFGQIGVLIAREIMKFKSTSDRSNNYKEKIKCFINQYKNYKFGDGYLPENEDQIENIADNGAIRISFSAYLNWLSGRISTDILKRETLKSVDFTNTQLFFISYAQMYCSNLMENGKSVLPDNKDFIPEKIRVNAALSNFEEFSTEFNCPLGSIMNPPDKCIYI